MFYEKGTLMAVEKITIQMLLMLIQMGYPQYF